jgi:hypothetical protein
MQNWRALEIQFSKTARTPSRFRSWLWRHIGSPYISFLEKLLRNC